MEPTDTPPGAPPEPTEKPTPAPPGGPPPPAAEIVLKGGKTEREVALERDLKAHETRLAELEDENHRLKTVTRPALPKKSHWLDGATLLD